MNATNDFLDVMRNNYYIILLDQLALPSFTLKNTYILQIILFGVKECVLCYILIGFRSKIWTKIKCSLQLKAEHSIEQRIREIKTT